jgi:hypothetical protein
MKKKKNTEYKIKNFHVVDNNSDYASSIRRL